MLRIAYSHSYETPLNENLVLSSATGAGGLAANVFGAYASVPLKPGIRNMYNAGLEQNFGSHFVFEGDYFWKFTRNAFDLDNLFTTAIFFPIEWDHSKMDGFSSRLSLRQYKGLTAYTQLGHTRARVFGPENGGLIFGSPVDPDACRAHRPRSGVPEHDARAVSAGEERPMGGVHVALRQRHRVRRRSGPGQRSRTDRGPAGPDRLLLRQPGGYTLESDHHLQCPLSELGSQIGEDPGARHGKRRH